MALKGKQHKLDKNKDGKISGKDFKMKSGGRVKKMGGGSMMMKQPMAGRMYKKGGSAKK